MDKEKAYGAMLVLFPEIPFKNFHCSPMVIRPKDSDKRMVILNLSYTKGSSLNDNVDKLHFDGEKFVLRFQIIDDICEEI